MRFQKFYLSLLFFFAVFCSINAQNINLSGSVSSDTTLYSDNIDTVKVVGNVTIEEGIAMTIEPGIVIDFTDNYYVDVQGSIYAIGNENDTIRFTTSDTSGYFNNSHHGWSGLRYNNTQWDTSRFQYCVFEYGKADSSHAVDMPGAGGAIFMSSSWSLFISHSAFRHNYAINEGAAIYSYYGYVNNEPQHIVSNVSFTHNESENNLGTVYSMRNYSLAFDSCQFSYNTGRAIVSDKHSSFNHVHPRITDSRFAYNSGSDGGALALLGDASGAGFITRTLFHNNYSTGVGGAIYNYSLEFQLANSILVNNEADGNGGAIWAYNTITNDNYNSFLTNNTIAYNKGYNGGGLACYDQYSGNNLKINKTLFYNNESTNTGINNDIYNIGNAYPYYYGCSFTTDLTNSGNTGFSSENIFNANPAFISPSTGIGKDFDGYDGRNWRPDWCISPCIDTGHTAYSENFSEYNDFDNRTRVINGTADIGAYEAPHGFTVMPTDMAFCEGDSAYFFMDRTAVGTVEWEISTDKGVTFTPTGSSTDTLLIAESATVSDDSVMVRLEASFNGCSASYTDTFMIRIYENPDVIASADADICLGDTINLKYQGEGIKSWGFSHNNHSYSLNGANNDSITLVTQDTLSIYVQSSLQQTASQTCYSYDTISVNVYPVPEYDVSDFQDNWELCEGDSIKIAIDTGYTYLWSTGDTTNAIYADTISADTLWVTDDYGCTQAFNFEVVNYSGSNPFMPVPEINLGPDSTYCIGKSIHLNVTIANGDYLWSDSTTSGSKYVTEAGTYSVRVMNSLNCYNYDTIDIDFEMMNTLTIGDTSFCNEGSINLNMPNHLTNATLRDTDSNFISSPYLVNEPGEYIVTGDSAGCNQVDTVQIMELAPFTINIGPDTMKVCDNETLSFGLNITDPEIATYTISDFNTTVTNDSITLVFDSSSPTSGISATATDTNNCEATDYIRLIDNMVVNSSMNLPVVNDPDVSFSIAGMPDNANSFYWDFGDSQSDISTEQAPTHTYPDNGTYTACLYVSNECNTDSSCSTFDINNATVDVQLNEIQNLSVYPVPAEDFVNIDLASRYSKVTIQWYTPDGIMVKNETLQSVSSIHQSIDDLPSGNYLLKVIADQQRSIIYILKK